MFRLGKQVFVAILLAILAVELETEEQGKGAEKKSAAQVKLKDALDPVLPDWANPIVYAMSGMLIDVLVRLANRSGFFKEFAADLSS